MASDQFLTVSYNRFPFFSYLFSLNGFDLINKITIKAAEAKAVQINITSTLGIFENFSREIVLSTETETEVADLDFKYNFPLIRGFVESELDTISIKIADGEQILHEDYFTLKILPLDHFPGINYIPQLLVSYILPNHPFVYKLMNEAVRIMEKMKWKPAFDGYQAKNPQRVLEVMNALYRAVQNYQITYSSLPPGFEEYGQKIRLPDTIQEHKFGNCIDLSLLFAACLEAADLNPIVVLVEGHAFTGVWLEDERFEDAVSNDRTALRKRIATGNRSIALVEATSLVRGSTQNLQDAINAAESQISDFVNFGVFVDVKAARARGVRPIPVSNLTQNSENEDFNLENSRLQNIDLGKKYEDLELTDVSGLTKQKVWERKLLDLSLRNNLLNLRFTKSMLQLVDLDVSLLEDALADGKSFNIHPNNSQEILRRYNLYLPKVHSTDPLFQFAHEEFKYKRLHTWYHEADLDTILTNLYRNAKLAEEENGKSTLYLGVGLLQWFQTNMPDQPRLAPILLIPVELSRKSANSRFTLRSREEETMINITLVEYLRQEYQLNLNALQALPMDENGVDVGKVLAIIRNAVINLKGWDVLEQTVLGNFSFNKLILWQDITQYSEELKKSKIVKSLIDGRLPDDMEILETDDSDLEKIPAAELSLPISADNSQLSAVKSAASGKSFILHGPPGTGKSQTITNIIADALSKEKKVLFVAAKKAALDVVHTRLSAIGLGPFCLELHSNKSKKSDVLSQIEDALYQTKSPLISDFAEKGARLDERKSGLAKNTEILHHRTKIGWSLYDSVVFLQNNKVDADRNLIFDFDPENISAEEYQKWQDFMTEFAPVVKRAGNPATHPLRFVSIKNFSFDSSQKLENAISNYLSGEQNFRNIQQNYNLLNDGSVKPILTAFKQISADEDFTNTWFDNQPMAENWLQNISSKQNLEAEILEKFQSSALNSDFGALQTDWNSAKNSWFLPKYFGKRKVKKQLSAISKNQISDDFQVEDFFDKKNKLNDYNSQISAAHFSKLNGISPKFFDGNKINVAEIQTRFDQLKNFDQTYRNFGFTDSQDWLRKNLSKKQNLSHELNSVENHSQNTAALQEFTQNIPDAETLKIAKNDLNLLENWTIYNAYKEKAVAKNLRWLVNFLNAGNIGSENLAFDFEKIIHLNFFTKTVMSNEEASSFNAEMYQSKIEQYRNLHDEYRDFTKKNLVAKLSARLPNVTAEAMKSSEIGILQKAIRGRGRGITIRRLFDQIPTLLPRLKPCMLMSPISVAQYFDANPEHFDLVIFDEASQLPTSEAISALARAKQAIIVGDPKQMPPTSFFAVARNQEEDFEVEDLESILDDCLALSIPSKFLLRHYRSRHESLIAFSNLNYYDNKLLTFPSCDDLERKVNTVFVDGIYDKSKTRTNKSEADEILKFIENHLRTGNQKSLGVVTFSQVQQALIEDLLEKLFAENPDLEEKSQKFSEPIFIKNLENVQGDERDIILFSVCYGPDSEGKVSMNFGPLNREGGWRRLNVAVTRARFEMKIFTTLKSEQIDLKRTNSEGVKGLKQFLQFAENGAFAGNSISEDSQNQEIAGVIANELEKHGLKVKTGIGKSGYKIDLGIVNPEDEKSYILAILLDGKNYQNLQTTNDRELLVPDVLKSLGWNIHRIWTLDWVKNKEAVIQSVLDEIEKVKSAKPEEIAVISEKNLPEVLVENDNPESEPSTIRGEAQPEIFTQNFSQNQTVRKEINQYSDSELSEIIREVIHENGSLEKGDLLRATVKKLGFARLGPRAEIALSQIVENLISTVILKENEGRVYLV